MSPQMEVIHPYLGFVSDPTTMPDRVSEYGFWEREDPFADRSDDTVVIGIFGGSVAGRLAGVAPLVIPRELKTTLSEYRNKKIIFLSFALGGYKQPQQLMTLAYFLALGAHFDMVVNLDGFNDIVLPGGDNVPRHSNPFFPRLWSGRVENIEDPSMLAQIGKLSLLDQARRRWAGLFDRLPFHDTLPALWLWSIVDDVFANKRLSWASAIEKSLGRENANYTALGPRYPWSDEEHVLADSARVWRRCSLEMSALCRAHRIRYYHFLQPNQYDAGSKIMTEAERKIAYQPGMPYERFALHGYPRLRAEGKRLTREGVRFYDLSRIFSRTDEPLYVDNCCHLNQKGTEMIASMIAQAIIADVKR